MTKDHAISVIIPAYNEEKTVGNLVVSLLTSKLIDEIVCIDDGSTDETYEILKPYEAKINLIHYLNNRGKGYALYRGIKESRGDIIVFLDSDLIGVSEEDIKKFVFPLVKGKSKMIIGYPRGRIFNTYPKSLSGQRAFFKEDLIPLLEKFKNKRYGIETYLNHIFKKPYEVKLSAYHLIKTEKMKPDEAFISYLHEAIEVVKERAKIRGVWNEDFEKTLRSFRKAKTWMQLKEKIKQAGNEDAKELFKKFFYNYFRRIKDSAPRRISSLYKFFKE